MRERERERTALLAAAKLDSPLDFRPNEIEMRRLLLTRVAAIGSCLLLFVGSTGKCQLAPSQCIEPAEKESQLAGGSETAKRA